MSEEFRNPGIELYLMIHKKNGFTWHVFTLQIVNASQVVDIQFLDVRNHRNAYLSIDTNRGSLTVLVVHRLAPIIASGSAKQLIKAFSLDGDQLGTICYYPTLMTYKIGPVSSFAFHSY